jgi:hypothetical protein
MKNLIIGFMLGMWCGPVVKEVSRQVVVRMHESLEKKKAAQASE